MPRHSGEKSFSVCRGRFAFKETLFSIALFSLCSLMVAVGGATVSSSYVDEGSNRGMADTMRTSARAGTESVRTAEAARDKEVCTMDEADRGRCWTGKGQPYSQHNTFSVP